MTPLQEFYESFPEPIQGCFLFLRKFILSNNEYIEEKWKWKLPFFYYKKKPFCYLWINKKTRMPYVCFVRSLHIDVLELELGNRKQMKALTIDPNKDIPQELLEVVMKESLSKFD